MSSPTFEILKVVATDAYNANPFIVGEVAGMLAKAPGFIGAWQGLDVEEPTYLWLVVAWESLEHHRAVMDDKENYPILIASLMKAAKDIVFMKHVKFSGDFTAALNAPATEFAIWTLKESTDRAQFQEGLAGLVHQIEKDIPGSDVVIGGFGAVMEDERQFVVGLGWNNVERFKVAVSSAPDVTAKVTPLLQLADCDLKLAKLLKYPGA